jgi:hypothetical protein
VKNTGHVGLVRENVADGNSFIGDQHRQLGDHLRTRPERFVGQAVLLDVAHPGQRNGLDQVEGLGTPTAWRMPQLTRRADAYDAALPTTKKASPLRGILIDHPASARIKFLARTQL